MTDDTKTLAEATARLQTMLPKIAKSEKANAGTYSYTYAGLDQITEKLMPILGKVGLSFIAKPTFNDKGEFVLAYKLLHVSGQSETGEYPLPKAGTPQSIGSAITYARRYCLTAVTGIAAGDDDDGHAAEVSHTTDAYERKQAARQKKAHEIRDKALNPVANADDLRALYATASAENVLAVEVANENDDREALAKLLIRIGTEKGATPAGAAS